MTALARSPRTAAVGGTLAFLAIVTGFAAFGIFEAARPKALLPFEVASLAATAAEASRIPGALAAVVGLVAVYVLFARGIDRRAGAYAMIVLATTPLWFVHARTLTSAIVPMTAGAAALAGMYLVAVDDRAGRAVRILALVATVAAAVVLVRARGISIAVSVALGIAAAAWLRGRRRVAIVVGIVALIAIAIAIAFAFVSVAVVPRVSLHATPRAGTFAFDAPLTPTLYALAPWSPLVPFAIVRRPRSPAQLAACVSAIAALVVQLLGVGGATADAAPDAPLYATPFVALAVAAMLRDLDDVASSDRTFTLLAAAVFTLGALLARDMGIAPERMLLGLGVQVEAGAVPAVARAADVVRVALWIVVVTATAALLLSRGVLGLRTLQFPRGAFLAAGGVAAGVLVRAHAWPVVLAGLSPGAAVETYVERRHADEPLAALGVDPRAMSRAARTDVTALADADAAARWLDEARDGKRRFLAVATKELARLNDLHRRRHHANVPVLAGARDAVVLVASALSPGEQSESPLDAVVRADVPAAIRPTRAVLGDGALEVVGWERDESAGRRQRVRVHLRARTDAPLRGHCSFIHVDHMPTRFSAEHLDHVYPSTFWREGDIIVDEFAFTLPAHFTSGSYELFWGAGVLPCTDDRRMPVVSGPHDAHHRVALGRLEVR